jgi:integrase
MLQTALSTGLRKGELAGLKWCDVDFDRRLILVCRSYERRGTKSGEDRTVPMPVELVRVLREWKAKSPFSRETDLCFPAADGICRKEHFSWSDVVHRIAVGADVARPGMSRWGHGTRHFYATQWLLQGGSDTILAKILGHRDTMLIHAVYSHFCDLDFVRALDRIGFTLEPKPEPISALPGVVLSEAKPTPEHAIG